MSIADQRVDNPTQKYIEFKSSKGAFQSYNKETKEYDVIPTPFEFIVLDEYATISGYHESSESGIYANEVKNTKKEPLTVKAFKGGEIADGLYTDIKGTVKAAGGKYTKSVYALYNGELVNIKIAGAAFSGYEDKKGVVHGGWMAQKVNTSKYRLLFKETIEGVKGTNKYLVPVFEQGSVINNDDYDEAVRVLSVLNEFKGANKDDADEEDYYDEEIQETIDKSEQLKREALEAFGDSGLEPKKKSKADELKDIL